MGLKTKALLLGGLAGAVYWQNAALDRHRLICAHPALPKAFDGFSILHLSDLHFGSESMARRKALSLKFGRPDLIAVTGDLLDCYTPEYLQAAGEWMERACRIAPVYYVPGNHEAKDLKHYPQVQKVLAQAGATLLENRGVLLPRGEESIGLLGIRDPRFFEGEQDFSAALGKLSQGKPGFSILLSHRPERLAQYAKEAFSLVLSGHAHGGQVRLPGIPGLYAPNQGLFPQYTSGLYRREATQMIVSRGIGNSLHCPRLLDFPEAATIVLRRKP